MNVNGKNIIVTGGGSGIGRELALLLVKKEAKVVICDINDDAMKETQKLAGHLSDKIIFHHLDISDKEQVYEFINKTIDQFGHIDGIINNAGIIQPFIHVKDLEYEQIERIVNINFYGTLYMTKALLPHLLQRPEAHIVNVSSMGGFIPFPGQTFYSATKAAVKTLTEGLFAELMNTSVKVTLIMPGAVETNITSNSGVEMKTTEEQKSKMKMLKAEEAAFQIIDAMEKNKYSALVGSDAKFLNLFYRLSPSRAVKFIVKQMSNL